MSLGEGFVGHLRAHEALDVMQRPSADARADEGPQVGALLQRLVPNPVQLFDVERLGEEAPNTGLRERERGDGIGSSRDSHHMRKPRPHSAKGRPTAGLVHHSDRGSTYASTDYRKALKTGGIECSMSRKGDCYDNAVAESFFSSLKREMDGADNMESWAGANISIGEYIDGFYNLQRRHSAISYKSPIESNCYIPRRTQRRKTVCRIGSTSMASNIRPAAQAQKSRGSRGSRALDRNWKRIGAPCAER